MTETIDSRQLRAFVTLAHLGSFTLAARQLFLSQSAVSHSMKSLERAVGCRLLDRVGRKVILTQAGEQLLHHGEKILAEMDAAQAALRHLGKWGITRLRLGASLTACQYILPRALGTLKEKFPQCLLHIEPGDTTEALAALVENRTDLAVVLLPRTDAQCEFTPLFRDEMFFVVAPSHPWAQRGRVAREEIPKQNYILYHKGSYTFRMVEDYFRYENVALNAVIEFGSIEAIKELVKLGLGVSILAPWTAAKELSEGTLVALTLGKRKLHRTWGVARRRGRPLNIVEETFITACRSAVELFSETDQEVARMASSVQFPAPATKA